MGPLAGEQQAAGMSADGPRCVAMGDAVLLRGVDDSDSVGYAVRGR